MTVAAQRFDFLSQETQVPISSFSGLKDSTILNDPRLRLNTGTESLQDLIDSSIQGAHLNLQELPAEFNFDDFARNSKDAMSQVMALSSMPSDKLTSYLGEVTKGNTEQTRKLTSLLQRCSANGMGGGIPGRPYDASVNCGAGKVSVGSQGRGSGCDSGSYSDLLNKLTGGGYSSGFQDLNKLLRSLMALAGYGYNLGLCGVFGALSKDIGNTDLLSRAAGSLMQSQGLAGNTNAFFDLTKNTAVMSLYPLASNPTAINTFLSNYSRPSNITNAGLYGLADRTFSAVGELNNRWNYSEYDGALSICTMEDYSDDLGDTYAAQLAHNEYGLDDLDRVPDDDLVFTCSAYDAAFA